MGKSVDEFCSYLNSRVGVSLYTLGAQGQSVKEKAREFVTEYEERYSTTPEQNIKRISRQLDAMLPKDIYFYDCSGLGIAWLLTMDLIKQDYTADGMYRHLCSKISREELRRGDWVFVRNNKTENIFHVGYVVDDALNVVEAKSRDDGVVKRPLSAGDWNVFGRPDKVFQELTGRQETIRISRVLYLASPYLQGEDVQALQKAIRKSGISIEIDGVFGPDTKKALILAQKQLFAGKSSEWDGQAGEKTVTALGLVWRA